MSLIVHYFFNGSVFVDDDLDTASNWNGNQTADKPKSIHADDDRNKNNNWRQTKTFTLYTWGYDIVFNLLIDEVEEEEAESCPWRIDEKKKGVDNTGDDWSKHGDEVEEE